MKQNSTFTSSQLQEFWGLINEERLDDAFEYLKSKAHDPSKGRRKRRSKYQEEHEY